MKPTELVTVVIPNYNHEPFLQQRIESVLNQSFQNFELFILDDCSTDNSLKVLSQFQTHPKVKGIIKNNTNSGSLFKQWVKAINLASGKYLWIAESDDFCHVDFLTETIGLAEQHQDCGLIFTDSIIVDKFGTFSERLSNVNDIYFNLKKVEFYKFTNRSEVLDNFVSNLVILNASAVLFRTEAIKKVNLDKLQTFQNAGDVFTYISIALNSCFLYLNKPLNYFRSHEHNTTKKNILSGAIFRDRQIVMTYFIGQLHTLQGSQKHLMSFFSRNFLTAVDFKLYNQVTGLLKAYYRLNIVPLSTYLKLYFYICFSRVFNKVPYALRTYIKKVLQQ